MNKQECVKALGVIAAMHNFTLPVMLIDFYDSEFRRVGYPLAHETLQKLVRTCRKFPTIPDFLEACGQKPPDEKDEATALATLIYQRISKGTHTAALEETRRQVGEFGWYVIEQIGGLCKLSDTITDDNRSTFIAQTRDTIKGCKKDFNSQTAIGSGSFNVVAFITDANKDKI